MIIHTKKLYNKISKNSSIYSLTIHRFPVYDNTVLQQPNDISQTADRCRAGLTQNILWGTAVFRSRFVPGRAAGCEISSKNKTV
ncbi:hypothetical protein HMPREF3293_02689 [Christensenella minuta]|uniref:Uncharacterized protein n=1 Tax=Christensenella minuta TaxID=626937 RepID=A0A136Q1R7_9FIRM|nr:hypothetical protein HMPREF3293_02689 [Christensenella minuta]